MPKLPRYYDSNKLIHGLKNCGGHLCFAQISLERKRKNELIFSSCSHIKQNEHLKYDFILNMSYALFNISLPSIQLDVKNLLFKFKSTSMCIGK